MIRVWRLTDAKYAQQAFDGEGARRYGGRWNHKGSRVVYTSDSLALAALEQLVHISAGLPLPPRVALAVDIPDEIPRLEYFPEDLPEGWRRSDGVKALRDLGTEWVLSARTAVLGVPSVVIPQERNYVFNPNHEDFEKLEFHEATPFEFDPRLLS